MPRKLHEGVTPAWPLTTLPIPPTYEFDDINVTQHAVTALTSYDILPTILGVERIVVPGHPRIFHAPALPLTLPRDPPAELIIEAFPSCPLEPLFRALAVTAPHVDPGSFDIVTDRRNLRLLLDFVNDAPQEFRLNAEVVDGTVMLCVSSLTNARVPGPGEDAMAEGEGHEGVGGEKAETEGDKEETGGEKETVGENVETGVSKSEPSPLTPPPPTAPPELTTPTGHRLIFSGTFVPQSSVLQIKSCSLKAPPASILARALPQMWFSRTPLFCKGLRSGDMFSRLLLNNLEEEGTFQKWQDENADSLAKVVKTLYALKNTMARLAGKDGRRRFAIICRRPRGKLLVKTKLEVYGLDEAYDFGLPEDLVEKLRGTGGSAAGLEAALMGLDIDDDFEQDTPPPPLNTPLRRGGFRGGRGEVLH
ncbi:hypothetical protein BZA05DRAFT_434084 [Tricharina praecox]|uniref:uncharacterized protein n=1 Tax=Tricharina praecox TaxID=43433 RepID=UPI0022210DE2|nr:uncharacterized protein BZA05DRAFT_434084 [Tricharina praecox]KAI5856540.1 hypothetical protein BZA05DRAFT_434084 [Tricharina praecox]